jgi:hypothetical protein
MTDDKVLLLGITWSFVQIVRAIPALVWSFRCCPTSAGYRCPPIFPRLTNDRREKPTAP